jgi:ATP-dependent helicase/nuclease subunit B
LSGEGLLLPRMAVVGDLDLDETLGPLLDPLGAGAEFRPLPIRSGAGLRLAELLREVEGEDAGKAPGLLRRAFEIGRTMDRLLVEGFAPMILTDRGGIVKRNGQPLEGQHPLFARVQRVGWPSLAERGEVDPPERRNRLFAHAATAGGPIRPHPDRGRRGDQRLARLPGCCAWSANCRQAP